MISTAVGSERISRVVGYKLRKGSYQTSSPNLPQRIAILGEANHANQANLSVMPREITTAADAAYWFGAGSPIHQMMRILRPSSGDGVGGIPTMVYPIAEANGATATTIDLDLTIATTATDSNTHYVIINGRNGIDGQAYAYSVNKGDSKATIEAAIAAAINGVLSAPCSAVVGGSWLTLTSKWYGATSAEMQVRFDTNGNDCGITYVQHAKTSGTGAPSLTTALAAFGGAWNTIVVNQFGETTNSTLETTNGIPDPDTPTGRYAGTIFKPFIAIWGSIEHTAATIGALTEARKANVTCAVAPAPYSEGFSWEAAANMTYLFARLAQDSPHLDVNGKAYPDMPIPADSIIGDMSVYTNRDYLVKKGCSTVDLIAGAYVVQDFVTTYHPDGEIPPQYRYCRNLILDWNVRYGYYLLELAYVVDKTIAPSDQSVSVDGVIKPKDWKQVIRSYADDLANRALIADASFMKSSLTVESSEDNPDRLDTFFRYKRTGVARISSTDAEAGFAFGVV